MTVPLRHPASPRAPSGARVFVVQETDLNVLSASDYGELIFLLPRGHNVVFNAQPMARHLRAAMRGAGPADCLLPLGDPVAIMVAGTVFAELTGGRLGVLKYDRQERRYFRVDVDVFDREPVAKTGS